MQEVLVSLGAYGASEVRRHGQAVFARIALDAGADGVEVRGELLVDPVAELLAIRAAADGKRLVYSSPDGLWRGNGNSCEFDEAAVARAIDATKQLGAPRVKMSIGAFDARTAQIQSLAIFAQRGIELVIENDQTAQAGTLDALCAFYEAADKAGVAPGLTFDMGNWHWTGECPMRASEVLASRVVYVHCKGVQRLPAKWVAVPIAESQAPWRTLLRAMPSGVPWAIEYPLVGDDLVAVTHREIALLRSAMPVQVPARR
jgi:sugar phosphate isomerase/epimerase